MMPVCLNCAWYSLGFGDDARGIGYCYSEDVYVAQDSLCDCWQGSLRSEPVNDPPERMLAQNVSRMDVEVED